MTPGMRVFMMKRRGKAHHPRCSPEALNALSGPHLFSASGEPARSGKKPLRVRDLRKLVHNSLWISRDRPTRSQLARRAKRRVGCKSLPKKNSPRSRRMTWGFADKDATLTTSRLYTVATTQSIGAM